MSKHNERNQADNLMKLFQEVANHSPDDPIEEQDELDFTERVTENKEQSYVELDLLNLPPRSEVHQKNKSRYSFTFINPFTRLLFVIIVVIGMIALLLYFDIIDEPFSFFYFVESSHIMEIGYSIENQKVI